MGDDVDQFGFHSAVGGDGGDGGLDEAEGVLFVDVTPSLPTDYCWGVDERDLAYRRVAAHRQVGGESSAEGVERVACRPGRPCDFCHHAGLDRFQHRFEERFFALEVVVQRTPA